MGRFGGSAVTIFEGFGDVLGKVSGFVLEVKNPARNLLKTSKTLLKPAKLSQVFLGEVVRSNFNTRESNTREIYRFFGHNSAQSRS